MYDDDEQEEEEQSHPDRMWSDSQLKANAYLVSLLQGTTPPVGLHPFATTTRFSQIISLLGKTLHIEQASRLFEEALIDRMGYDYDSVLDGKEEYECRKVGV